MGDAAPDVDPDPGVGQAPGGDGAPAPAAMPAPGHARATLYDDASSLEKFVRIRRERLAQRAWRKIQSRQNDPRPEGLVPGRAAFHVDAPRDSDDNEQEEEEPVDRVSIADPPKPHPCPNRELFGAARSHEDKANRALDILDSPHVLSFAFEHALWTTVLRARGSEFPLRRLGVVMTRLDVAVIVYLLLPSLRPMSEKERLGAATLSARLVVDVPGAEPESFGVVLNDIRIAILTEVLAHDLGEPGSLVDAFERLRSQLDANRNPQFDAPLPSSESMCRLAVMLAAKNIYSVRIPSLAGTAIATIATKSIGALHLLPPEPAATIDGSLKPRDASLVLTRLAVFCNEDHRSEQSVNLCQLAIARWSKSPVAWVTLHNALRRLGAAVRLPSHCDELFNPADCYLEAIKHDAANGLANLGCTHGEVEAARDRLDLSPRFAVDSTDAHWLTAKSTKLCVFAAVGAFAFAVSRCASAAAK